MNHGQYLINKALRKELELYKRVQKTRGFSAKETTLQAMWVDKILSIGNRDLISWRQDMLEKVKIFDNIGDYIKYKKNMQMVLSDWKESALIIDDGQVIVKFIKF